MKTSNLHEFRRQVIGKQARLLCVRPDPRGVIGFKEFHVNDVWIAANGAVFNVLLIVSAGTVDRDHDPFAAGGAGIGPLIRRVSPFS